jgi:serpin B
LSIGHWLAHSEVQDILVLRWSTTFCVSFFLAALAPPPGQAQPREPVVTAANAFGLDLYGALRQRGGNLFFSPFNISTAFSMAASGARGPTAIEMRKVLHQAGAAREVDTAIGRLSREMAKRQDVQLSSANALWIDKRFALNEAYRQAMTQTFDGGVQEVDFVEDGEGARNTINRWVEARTADRIKDLLARPAPGPLVITSALYLKAEWSKPFEKEATVDGDFHLSGAAVVRAPLMKVEANLRHLDDGAFQAVAIPYRGDMSMVIFLPKRVDGLPAFERGLGAGKLEGWLGALDAQPARDVTLTLPRYKLDDGFQLKELLQALGMRLAFTDAADFTGIEPRGALCVAEAVHKTFLAVDEAGTEAAAATAIVIVTTSARRNPPHPIDSAPTTRSIS